MLADSIWKGFGGGRSAEAKLWDAYRQSSNLKAKFSNARDYFLSSFNRWRQDPGQFSKKYPREGKLLKKIWDTFQEGLSEVE